MSRDAIDPPALFRCSAFLAFASARDVTRIGRWGGGAPGERLGLAQAHEGGLSGLRDRERPRGSAIGAVRAGDGARGGRGIVVAPPARHPHLRRGLALEGLPSLRVRRRARRRRSARDIAGMTHRLAADGAHGRAHVAAVRARGRGGAAGGRAAPGARAGADRREGRRVREARHRERRLARRDAAGGVARWFLPRRGGREKRGAYRNASGVAIRRGSLRRRKSTRAVLCGFRRASRTHPREKHKQLASVERSQQSAGFRFPDIFFGLPRRARTNEKIEKRGGADWILSSA